MGFFQDLLVRTGDDLDRHSPNGQFAPTVLIVKGAEKLMARAAKECHMAGILFGMVLNESVDVGFP